MTRSCLILSRYRLVGLLARGGQGEVYLGEEAGTGRKVAAKRVSACAADPQAAGRLRREAELLGRVDSEHVVRLVEAGVDEPSQVFWVVEEVARGVPASLLVERSGPFPPALAAEVVRQVAEGLEALHRVGCVVRDLTPAQVLVDPCRGGVRCTLVDLGFGMRVGGDTRLTDPAYAVGTPGYVAPELAAGEAAAPAADVYSLAAVAFHLLAGSPPFEGPSGEAVLAMQVAEAVAPLPAVSGLKGVSLKRVRVLLRRALSADPRRRPGSPGEFAWGLVEAVG